MLPLEAVAVMVGLEADSLPVPSVFPFFFPVLGFFPLWSVSIPVSSTGDLLTFLLPSPPSSNFSSDSLRSGVVGLPLPCDVCVGTPVWTLLSSSPFLY